MDNSPFPQLANPAQANAPVIVNEILAALGPFGCYAKAYLTTTGLTWGYYGGRWGGFDITAGTLTLDDSDDNYIVVEIATGDISASTGMTDWNDDANFLRVYKVTTGASAVSDIEDHRGGPAGLWSGGGTGGGGGGGTVVGGLDFTASSTTTDSDPGTGKLRWNNATQASATFLYIDNTDGDATSLATLWAALLPGSLAKITDAADEDVWQLFKMTAAPVNGTGYYKFAVSLVAQEGGNIADTTSILLDIDASALGDASTNTSSSVDGEVVLFSGTSGKTLKRATATGTPYLTAGVQSINKITLTQPATGSTLTILDGKTATFNNTLTVAGVDGKTATFNKSITFDGADSTTMTFPPASASIGYLNIPQNSQSTAYTTVIGDAGKHLYHPSADTTARTWTIDSNANVAYPIGTAITFVNDTSAGVITIAITSDTLVLSPAGTTGSRSLAANGIATAVKVTSTRWIISGSGLT